MQELLPLDGHVFREEHGQIAWGKTLYDAYIKAYRWSTDRLDPNHGGIIAFVSPGHGLMQMEWTVLERRSKTSSQASGCLIYGGISEQVVN